jgi:hypothetical protein
MAPSREVRAVLGPEEEMIFGINRVPSNEARGEALFLGGGWVTLMPFAVQPRQSLGRA